MQGNKSRILASLVLDGLLYQNYDKRLARHFTSKKYQLVVQDILSPFVEGKSHISLFGRPFYYASRFGIGFLQGVLLEDAFLKHYIQPGATIIDVGANIGQFNVFCTAALEAKRVISFEPLPACFALLEKNVDEAYLCAITCEKEVEMNYSDSTLTATSVPGVKGTHTLKAKGVRLDEHPAVKDLEVIDLLKIDTEGTEFDVLHSAKKILPKTRFILVEASITRSNSGDVQKVIDFMKEQKPSFKLAATGINYMGPSEQMEACDMLFAREEELKDLKK